MIRRLISYDCSHQDRFLAKQIVKEITIIQCGHFEVRKIWSDLVNTDGVMMMMNMKNKSPISALATASV